MDYILGIDVGATGIKGNLVDTEKGMVVKDRVKIKTPSSSTPDAIADTIRQIIKSFDWKGKPTGIGFPAIVNKGKTLSAANVDNSWLNFPALTFFEDQLNCPVSLVNDADAAGMAEIEFGVGKNVPGTVLLLTLGSGIGSAMFRNGELIPNTELGHLKWKNKIAEKSASNRVRENNNLDWATWGGQLDQVLGHIDFLFSPDLIILGGGVSKKFEEYDRYIVSPKSKVVPAKMKNDAGIIGAALYFSKTHKK